MTFKPAMSTPDDSPASFIPSSGAGTRKRVEFSPWPNVVDTKTSTPTPETAVLKALPPSRDCHKNSKSILKPYNGAEVSLTNHDGTNEAQIACPEMLEAITQQLSNNNKGSSLDAYQTLSQVIKAYDEIPEDVNTRSCIAAILRCIKRDLSMQDQTQSSPIDTNLMAHALKVAVILVWSEHLSPLLTDEFRVFIVDRSVNTIAEHTAPKVIIMHYMHLLAMQNFRPGILSSNNRAGKLLEALQDITNHIQGKGAIGERLLIYHKLIEQAKPVMKTRASLWIKEVFLGLASSFKDIRDKAISVSTRACAAFPSSPTISSAAREALASIVSDKTDNDRTVNTILTQRLDRMVAAKDEAIQVPQIWAIVMLLCNKVDLRLDSWNLLRDWLRVIQRCFNCSDSAVRSQTFPAWNRFVHVGRPHEASDTVVLMLAKPIVAQLARTSGNMTGKGLRPATISSYCMLLYHAFRPAASHKQYTRMWNEYIVKIMGSELLSNSSANADLCSRIIMSLMWKDASSSRIWNENRAHENTFMEPEELPSIDCKWIRSKTEAILQYFRLLFKYSVWGPSVQCSDQAYVAKAWKHFLKAVCESASKEIKPSTETKKALSYIIQFIQETPANHSIDSKGDNTQDCIKLISGIAVAELGSIPLLEAMDNHPNLQCRVILQELLRTALSHAASSEQDITSTKPHTQPGLSNALQRSLKFLDQNLLLAYGTRGTIPTHDLRQWTKTMLKTLELIPTHLVLPCLILLEESLTVIIQHYNRSMAIVLEPSGLEEHHSRILEIVTEKVLLLSASEYARFDDLLAAMLSSKNTFARILLLEAGKFTTKTHSKLSYGPRSVDAIALMNQAVEVTHHTPETPVRAHTTRNASPKHGYNFALVDQPVLPVLRGTIPPSELDKATQCTRAPPANKDGPKRPHHNDSQIHFEPVNSSPKCPNEIESQFLTDRQKEIRDRQRTEPAITFTDLRSSPRPRSSRGSRAPSIECEIARKAAAIQALTSTPNINRQQDDMDEDELPTPTPKARHKAIDMVGVDIPSSPPSISANRKTNVGVNDVPSSPPKEQNEAEVDMLDLSDENLSAEQLLNVADKSNNEIEQDVPSVAAKSDAKDVLDDAQLYVSEAVAALTQKESNLGSTVLETVEETNKCGSNPAAPIYQTCAAVETDHDVDSDEIDELSASQLSQSLDSHIADEARHSRAAAEPQFSKAVAPKRRKRAVSGYADQDRKKRRKRTSFRNETSHSSAASDEFSSMTGSREEIVVSTSPIVNTHEQRTPTSTPTQRRQAHYNHTERLPLHFKSPASQNIEKEMKSSSPSQAESSIASTQVLDESIYESVAKHSAREDQNSHARKMGSNEVSFHENGKGNTIIEIESRTSDARNMGIMTALRTALKGLTDMGKEEQVNIDLKAIDDLCFNIRYQAQELAKGRNRS